MKGLRRVIIGAGSEVTMTRQYSDGKTFTFVGARLYRMIPGCVEAFYKEKR